jgi:hypothetical protein
MKNILRRDSHKLRMDGEKIRQGLEKLKRDCSEWARKQEEKDLAELLEKLKGVEMDVSLMLTDCISAGCRFGEGAPRVVFHDFREIFRCLDTLFNGLKKARRQLAKDYIHPGTPHRLEIDYERFIKLVGRVQRNLNAEQGQTVIPLDAVGGHVTQGHALSL